MKLRIKTFAFFIVTTICLIIILHVISESIILDNASQLEQAEVSNTIGQLQIEWTNELNQYQTKAEGWAKKIDTKSFIAAQSTHFNSSTEMINSLVDLGANYVMLYSASGKFIAGFGFNLTTYRQEPLPNDLVSKAQASDSIIKNVDRSTSGVLVISAGPLVVSSIPIESSSRALQESNIVVLARYIDSDEVSSLSRSMQLPVTLQLYNQSQTNTESQSVMFSVPLNTNYIVGYNIIKDCNGQSALVLGVTMPRTVYVQGVITVNYIDRLVLVSCVVFSVAIVLMLEFMVLSKLSKLTHAVTKISEHKNPSERLPTNGNDEFETLTRSINKMLAKIEENNDKLQKAQRFSAIGELATMIAHDLRNPLQGIANAAFYLKRKPNPMTTEKEKEMIQLIQEAVRYSDKIVNDLLDYSRDLRLDLIAASPRSLINSSLLVCNIPERIPVINETTDEPMVLVDVDIIKRVFGNLICNAVDAMPNGGTLRINCQTRDGMARFTFADAGVGMTEEVKQKIFQPLFTTKAKGMGFGLSICKRIIDAHKGRIEVDSAVGKGSVFSVYLPIVAPKQLDV